MNTSRNWREHLTPSEKVEIAAADSARKRVEREKVAWGKKYAGSTAGVFAPQNSPHHAIPPRPIDQKVDDMSQQLELAEKRDAVPAPAQPSNMLALIGRLAQDPTVDADKMERIMAMQERLEVRQAKSAYTQALVLMKPLLPVIARDGKIIITDKADKTKVIQSTSFALWEDIDAAITPILSDHGFVLTFRPGTAPDGKVSVTAILSHAQGHSDEATVTLPHDSSGSKNAAQAVGSSLSYGKRYSATAILNIRTKGEDDDSNEGFKPDATLTDDEILQVYDRLKITKGDTDKFVKYMKVPSVADILRKNFGAALEAIESAAAARAKKVVTK